MYQKIHNANIYAFLVIIICPSTPGLLLALFCELIYVCINQGCFLVWFLLAHLLLSAYDCHLLLSVCARLTQFSPSDPDVTIFKIFDGDTE